MYSQCNFIDRQNKNDSDMISFEDGLQNFKGSKQQGIEEAIQRAQQIIEQQSNQKKKSSQQIQSKQSCQQNLVNKSTNQTEGVKNDFGLKTTSSQLSKRKNPQNNVDTSNELKSSKAANIQEQQPSKKLKTENKGKITPVQTPRSNSSTKNSQIGSNQSSTLNKNVAVNKKENKILQENPTSKNGANKKKNEKINEKQEQKNQKNKQNDMDEGKRTPTRASTQKQKEDQQIQENKIQVKKGSVSPLKLKKQDIESQKQLQNIQQQKIKKSISVTNKENYEEKSLTRTLKKQPNEEQKQNEKKNKRDKSKSQDTQKKKTQTSSHLEISNVGKKKESSKISQSSKSATSSKVQISKKEKKQESKKSKTNDKNNENLKQIIKEEQLSSDKKNYNRNRNKWNSSKKKEKNGDYMDEEEQQKYNYNTNNFYDQGYYEQNNFQNQNINQQLQESPDFGFKQQRETVISNINMHSPFDDLSKNQFQGIQNSLIMNNFNSGLSNPLTNGINNHFIESNIHQIRNNIFQSNEKKPSFQDNNPKIFSLNNSPFGIKDRNMYDDQDELNLTSQPNESKQILTINQQYQLLLNALKAGEITPQQFEYYQQKYQNGNLNLFENENKQNNNKNNQNQINQNNKVNNLFETLSQNQGYSPERKSKEINALNNITNTFQTYNSQQNVNNQLQNSLLNGISISNSMNNQGTANLITQQNILQFGMPKQEYQSSSLNPQMYGINQQSDDFLSQNDIIGLPKSLSLQSRQNSLSSGVQDAFSNPFQSLSLEQQNSNSHSIIIPSPKKVVAKSSNQNILPISNNSSFKLSPQIHKKCQIHQLMKHKILPMLEGKLKNKIYYENEKDMWLCEIVDCVRSLKTIPIEQIYNGEYAMLLEQIYDALLTIQDQTKRNFSYVLSMIQRTMTDLDKKIIKHLHDYSRVRGEKYQITREEENLKRNAQASLEVIKIEDKDDSIEFSSSINGSIRKQNNKQQNNIDFKIKIDPKINQNSCSPKKQKYGEYLSTAKKQNSINNYKDVMQNGDSFNSCNSNNTTFGNTASALNINSSPNNDLFSQSINESLYEINQQPDKPTNLILDEQTIQSLEKIVKQEVTF